MYKDNFKKNNFKRGNRGGNNNAGKEPGNKMIFVERDKPLTMDIIDKKLEVLLHSLPDSPERRQKATALLDSRDQR